MIEYLLKHDGLMSSTKGSDKQCMCNIQILQSKSTLFHCVTAWDNDI